MIVYAAACAGQQTQNIEVARSTLTVRAYKSGLLSGFAHDHTIGGRIAQGSIRTGDSPAVELEIAAADLKVIDPELAADKRAEVQQRMLGSDVLDAQRFPRILFHSTSVQPDGNNRWRVQGELTLHGQNQPIAFSVSKSGESYVGRATLKQRAFGIKPVSIAGGTVKVKDEVVVEFSIIAAESSDH